MIEFSSGESDDDEEIVQYIAASNIFNRHFAGRRNHFVDMRPSDFHRRFRMTKETVSILLTKIESRLLHLTSRNRPVSPMDQLLCALRYYATGSQLVTCGDFIGVHETTAGRIVHSVTHAIASLAPMYIKMPSSSEEQQTAAIQFYEIARFPCCIGAIDCTHVKIISPGGQVPELYRNRKGVFTINVQAIVNANAVFTDVVARKHGSAHDSYIWDTSYQKRCFLEGAYGNKVLVGDSGYAQTPYMMVPLQNVSNNAQSLYNESQIRTRNVVERTLEIWKRRFPILAKGIQVRLKRVPGIIVATAVLHNICRAEGDADPPLEDVGLTLPDYQPAAPIQNQSNETRMTPGQQARHNLIEQYFSRLR